ncbi:uncharacterized protein J4E92_002740 [Alternaria infectoria]|uniref:uncharacterized protein n=1 Tax=Alternaria infectoria TaxID=45303 RepID=UPI00221E52C0|nr:uncharacterized protein J4E92_002740 [Alternaria infectoria]KAI4935451.1 hypothetical protein J4E92_002740 [Alternaria infectoria]
MTVPKVKSRAQLRSQKKSRRTSKKHHVEKPKAKQTNSDAQSPTKAPKVYTSSAESNDPIYDDNSNPVDDNGSSFARRHVLTTDDQESAGAFKSGLRTVLIRDRAPVTTDGSEAVRSATDEQDHETSGTCESDNRNESGDDGISAIPCGSGAPTEFEDEDDDPPASLLNLAPIWYPQPDWSWPETRPAATETTLGDSPVAELATAGPSQLLYSSGSHHYINFGSGIIVSPMHNDVNNVPPPVSIISWIREDRDSDAALPLPSQPHLELRYLIPATFDKRMRLNYHSNIHPAPQHDSVGKVATHEDASPTNNVQRGFVVANRPASAPSPPRRDIDHYSSLLARDDTNWAEWNKLNITADAMPFTRSQSDTQFLHPQTGAKMARANGHLTKSQTGHAFLEDAGHRYPFGQGPGW